MGKKILFLGACMDRGGIANAFNMLAPKLEANGYEINVVVPYKSDIPQLCIPLRYVCGYVWRHKLNNKWARRALNLINWVTGWRLYFAFAKKYTHDIFVVYAANMMPWWVMYSSKPVLGWLHGKWALRTNTFMGRFFRRWVNYLCKRYSKVISVSESSAKDWVREFNLSVRPTVIPNIIDIGEILQQSNESQSCIVKGGTPILLTVGRLSSEKGQLRLIDVYGRLKRNGYAFTAYFIGGGAIERECQERINAIGLSSDVHMLGELSNPYPYMLASDLLVVPSINEGRSYVITEALTLGLPVVSTDCGGPREVLRNGEWGRLVANTEDGLYEGIKAFLENPQSSVPRINKLEIRQELQDEDKRNVREILEIVDNLD